MTLWDGRVAIVPATLTWAYFYGDGMDDEFTIEKLREAWELLKKQNQAAKWLVHDEETGELYYTNTAPWLERKQETEFSPWWVKTHDINE